MKLLDKALVLLVIAIAAVSTLSAQTYYKVDHLTGDKLYKANTVNVTSTYPPSVQNVCGYLGGPYGLGDDNPNPNLPEDSYKFKFSIPVSAVRILAVNVGGEDTMGIRINGQFFNITPGDLTSLIGICGFGNSILHNGLICSNPNTNTSIQVDIHPTIPIDSIEIFSTAVNAGGISCGVYYTIDPQVFVFTPGFDNTLCLEDSVDLAYIVTDSFNAANTFTAQLSDANGDFSKAIEIGARKYNDQGSIKCHLPNTLPEGNGYRLRFIASLPKDTSVDNGSDIRISRYPAVAGTSNSPICNGDELKLDFNIPDTGVKFQWRGPGFFSAEKSPSLTATGGAAGGYNVIANKFGCITEDSITVVVKPQPSITSIKNNGPICELERLELRAQANFEKATYNWTGPNNFTAATSVAYLDNTSIWGDGNYGVTATFDGCLSVPSYTNVQVNKRPAKPAVDKTISVIPGEDILLKVHNADSSATYIWSGPSGFAAYATDTTIKQAVVYDEGTYFVTAEINGCKSGDSLIVKVLASETSYQLSPNPASASSVVSLSGNLLALPEMPVEITDMAGNVVHRTAITTTDKYLRVMVPLPGNMHSGVYFMRIKLKDQLLNVRFAVTE